MISENEEGYNRQEWQKLYEDGDLRWDLGCVSPPFMHLWRGGKLNPGKMLIPGCGRGHEVVFFAKQGFEVTAVDFAPGAVSCLTETLSEKGVQAQILQKDFFELESLHDSSYDFVLEQTFFCAIVPSMRLLYINTVHRVLKENGLLVALFYETHEKGGPPFHTAHEDIPDLFLKKFFIEYLEKTPYSVERRNGKEWLGILRKK